MSDQLANLCLRNLRNYSPRQMLTMPDSPADSKPTLLSPASLSPTAGGGLSTSHSRPHLLVTSFTGRLSPGHGGSGHTPSPPETASSLACQQQTTPGGGARQLSKLKRFLTTLIQFGLDISVDIGERVRSLVLALVNSHVTIEEFHGKLQEATNFPLRPFVIPFLRANLPLLQRELAHCARLARQTPQQYLANNEHAIFDCATGGSSPLDHQDITADFNENGKRHSPDRPKEGGMEPMDLLHPAKRPMFSPGSTSSTVRRGSGLPLAGPIRLDDICRERELRENRERHLVTPFSYSRFEPFELSDRLEDEWRNADMMMQNMLSMADKCRRSLVVLQEKTQRERDKLLWLRRSEHESAKRRSSDHGLSSERVLEVQRRAEEAMQEVKRQAVCELQKAVTAAEAKAIELVAIEKAKMERLLIENKKLAHDELLEALNKQEDCAENCWNCGRKASETCSGCNTARYCGSFCQHKDWDNHHRVCRQGQGNSSSSSGSASTRHQHQHSSTSRSRSPFTRVHEPSTSTLSSRSHASPSRSDERASGKPAVVAGSSCASPEVATTVD